MMPRFLKKALGLKESHRPEDEPSWSFLKEIPGVMHIGANLGQERDLYARLGLNVLWVEPVEEVFKQLQTNIAGYPKQRALQRLITDKDGEEYTFHLSNNDAASSSIFDFADHKQLWPEVHFTKTLQLKSVTLPTLVAQEGVRLDDYGALVLDTQGSELLILKGAAPVLERFRFVRTEAADFESYKGGCTLKELDAFLESVGFKQRLKSKFAGKSGVGDYYEALYAR